MNQSGILEQLDASLLEWWQNQDQETLSTEALSAEKVEEMHHIAYNLYQDRQYDRAAHFFRLLTIVNPLEMKYWKGLGASLQMTKDYEQAIQYYVSAQLVCQNKPDPYLYVYAADCYFALGQKQESLKALEGAQLIATEQNNVKVLNHVALMKDLWSNNKN